MKKTISALLSAIMVLAALPSAGYAAGDEMTVYKQTVDKTYVNANFDNNALPSGSGCSTTSTISFSDGVIVCGPKAGTLRRTIPAEKSRFEIDFRADGAESFYTIQTRSTVDGSAKFSAIATCSENGRLRFRDKDTNIIGTAFLSAGSWYRLCLDMDTGNHTYKAYLFDGNGNSVNIFDNNIAYPFLSSTLADYVSTSSAFDVGTGNTANTTLSLDNLVVSGLKVSGVSNGDSVNIGELGDDGAVFVSAPSDTLYDNGQQFGTSKYNAFDITGLAYGTHRLSSGSSEFKLDLYSNKEVKVSGSDFNGCTAPPNGFSRTVNDGYVKFATIDEGHGTSVLVGSEASVSNGALFNLNQIGKTYCSVSFDMYINGVAQTYIKLRESGSIQPNILRLDANGENGRLRVISGNDEKNGLKGFFGLDAKKWYNITLGFDMNKNEFSVTVVDADGKAVNNTYSGTNTVSASLVDGISGNSSLRVVGPKTKGEIAFDNMYVKMNAEVPLVKSIGDNGNVSAASDSFDVVLSSAIDPTSISGRSIVLKSADETMHAASVTVSDGGKRLTVVPERKLKYNTRYLLSLNKLTMNSDGFVFGRELVKEFDVTAADGINIATDQIRNASGNVLNQVEPGETAKIKADVYNNTADEKDIILLLAVYDTDDRMLAVNSSVAKLSADEDKKLETSLAVPEAFTDGSIKAMLWNTTDGNLTPLCSTIKLQKNKVEAPLTVHLVGDSICAKYAADYWPQQGYGEYVGNYFADGVTVKNYGAGGRSTKTFISEGKWQTVLDSIEQGDYVFVCMGHNDQSTDPARYTTIEEYKDYLRRYINEAHDKGAEVILITPITQASSGSNTLLERSTAMKAVAAEENVVLLDVNALTFDRWTQMGFENVRNTYFLSDPYLDALVQAGQLTNRDTHPNSNIQGENGQDLTHVNEAGADYIAAAIAELLGESGDPLASLLK